MAVGSGGNLHAVEGHAEGLGGRFHFLGDEAFLGDRGLGDETVGHRTKLQDEVEPQTGTQDVLLEAPIGSIRPGDLTSDVRHVGVADTHRVAGDDRGAHSDYRGVGDAVCDGSLRTNGRIIVTGCEEVGRCMSDRRIVRPGRDPASGIPPHACIRDIEFTNLPF